LWGITNIIPIDNIFHPVNFLNHSDRPAVRYYSLTGNYLANRNLYPEDEITIIMLATMTLYTIHLSTS